VLSLQKDKFDIVCKDWQRSDRYTCPQDWQLWCVSWQLRSLQANSKERKERIGGSTCDSIEEIGSVLERAAVYC
jgi:hypothetical protein